MWTMDIAEVHDPLATKLASNWPRSQPEYTDIRADARRLADDPAAHTLR
jgi:hypothetical protein